MSKSNVYILGGELAGRITNKPTIPYMEMMHLAGKKTLERAGVQPSEIESLRVASMSPESFPSKQTGEIAAELASIIGINQYATKQIIKGTSSAGALGLYGAWENIANNSNAEGYSLVIAGEQMNSLCIGEKTKEMKRIESQTITDILSGVTGEAEKKYGITMVDVGDLLMSAWSEKHGFKDEALREIVMPLITLSKYARAKNYPNAQFSDINIDLENYKKSALLTNYFRKHDLAPTSSAACAVLLSRKPPKNPLNGRIVRILGMGQGTDNPSIINRDGSILHSSALMGALYNACKNADVSLKYLRNSDGASIHDPFASIELLSYDALGFTDIEDILDLVISDKFNRFGGLSACGHPVGVSGLFYVAQSYHLLCGDENNIKKEALEVLPNTYFTNSVGAELTNILFTLLQAKNEDGSFPIIPDEERFNANEFELGKEHKKYDKNLKKLTDIKGMIIAKTPKKISDQKGYVYVVQLRDRKEFAYSPHDINLGKFIDIKHGDINEISTVYRGSLVKKTKNLIDKSIKLPKNIKFNRHLKHLQKELETTYGPSPSR